MKTTRTNQTPRNFFTEWLEEREMEPMAFLNAINDTEGPIVDKSQVYRWVNGQNPRGATLDRIAKVLKLEDPQLLFRHPAEAWILRRLRGRDAGDLQRARQAIDLVFPPSRGE